MHGADSNSFVQMLGLDKKLYAERTSTHSIVNESSLFGGIPSVPSGPSPPSSNGSTTEFAHTA